MNRKVNYKVCLIIALVSLVATLGFTISVRADLTGSEADLNPVGEAYEINPDIAGKFWISDFTAGEVWGVDPSSGAYEVYAVGGYPSDARQADGWLWWADGFSNILGRVSTSDGAFTQWEVPDVVGFYGTNLDDQGRLYAVDVLNPYLYRLDPDTAEICTFILPGDGSSNYIVRDGDYLWLGDGFDSTLMRLQISNNNLTSWSLPVDSSPFGMVVDSSGNLWYADQGTSGLAHLNPTTSQLTSFALPSGDYPEMITLQSDFIWYTESDLASIGRLDPLTADHTISTLSFQTQTLDPSCASISPSSTGTVTVTSGNLSWGDTSYPTILNNGGWRIFQMPNDSLPWGIVVPELGYVIDSGRQKLVRFTPEFPPTLVVIKHVINDSGGSASASDFTMTVDNPGANPASFPGAESPGTEVILDPGAYSVSEEGPNGYTASYSADCTGTLAIGETKVCTITNDDQQATVTVVKVVVNDDGGTALPNDFLLTLEGTSVLSGVATPVNPGSYTAGETLLPGYNFTGFSGDCDGNGDVTVALGESKICTLTNDDRVVGSIKIYLPIIIK
jgi:streptogramin lyase